MTVTPAGAPTAPLGGAASGSRRKAQTDRKAPAAARATDKHRDERVGATIELIAAVIAVSDDEPVVEVLVSADGREPERLPSARFLVETGQTLDDALRGPVEAETGHQIGYLQQLIAFAEPRPPGSDSVLPADVMIGYLALVHDSRRTRGGARKRARQSRWQGCYQHLPWEDWRGGRPRIVDEVILPRLVAWAKAGQSGLSKAALGRQQAGRAARVRLAFANPGSDWDEDKVLVRYDLLAEAGLLAEEMTGGRGLRGGRGGKAIADIALGRVMLAGHRRVLAAAIGRLRADIKNRPVIFELMDDAFSLYDLQQTVEAILGPDLHKQNFRRLVETTGLVEPTGEMKSHTGGRPAKLYRFRRDVLLERPAPSLKLKA